MRRVIAGPTILAFLFAFWGSPFFHLHTASVEAHHRGNAIEYDHETLIHAHLPVAVLVHAKTSVTDEEENARPIDIFTAVPPAGSAVTLPVLLPVRTALPTPVVSASGVFLPLWPRTHDPPSLSLLVPRAPPA